MIGGVAGIIAGEARMAAQAIKKPLGQGFRIMKRPRTAGACQRKYGLGAVPLDGSFQLFFNKAQRFLP